MPSLTATQSAEGKLTGLARLQVKAKQDRSLRFSNLLHHITPEMMEKAYKSLNRQSASISVVELRITLLFSAVYVLPVWY
jgi:hypothetical protein